jgi:molecular chaperone GrpE
MSDEAKQTAMDEVTKNNVPAQAAPEEKAGKDAANDAAATALTEPPLTVEQLAELKAKAAKADEYWNRLLRQTADFDNYKKRMARERTEDLKYAHRGFLEKLIPVIDNLEMALAAAGKSTDPAVQSIHTGVTMVFNQLKAVLAEAGLEEIDATGQTFDPNWHEAVSQEETTQVAEGQVMRQLRKGYRLKDRLLRPASVVVTRKPSS